jgi:hypothetical protein
MQEFESPIEVAVNVQRFLMDRVHGVLELQFNNRAANERFTCVLRINGRLLAEEQQWKFRLNGHGKRKKAFDLPRIADKSVGSMAGDARFDVEVDIETAEGGIHRFTGEFLLTVLAYAKSMQQVNVNINKVIEQHDKGGMGAINEIDLSNLVRLPGVQSVNDLIEQRRTARFVPIELEYQGEVEPETKAVPLIARDTPPLYRCAIVPDGSDKRLLIYTGQSLTLGRSRQKADIVTWIMPRSEHNDHETRKISSVHAELCFTADGPILRSRSGVNSTSVDGRVIRDELRLPTEQRVAVNLSSVFDLTITPVPLPQVRDAMWNAWRDEAFAVQRTMWDWSRQCGVGGYLLERSDALAECERYLWLLSMVGLGGQAMPLMHARAEVAVMALPRLALGNVGAKSTIHLVGYELDIASAAPMNVDEVCESVNIRFHVSFST